MDYFSEMDNLEKELSKNTNDSQHLSVIEARLNGLFLQFRDDETLGSDRYALYQLQAMLSYRQQDLDKAKRFIDYSVYVRGEDYKLATELNNRLINNDFSPKNENRWRWLIYAPLASLVVVALIQFIVHYTLTQHAAASTADTSSLFIRLVSIFSVLVGTVAIFLVMLLPIWIIELVAAKNFNDYQGYPAPLKRKTGILMASFLPFWYWFYTYKVDKSKFWLNLLLSIITAGYWGFVNWIWALILAIKRPDDFYILYPYYANLPINNKNK